MPIVSPVYHDTTGDIWGAWKKTWRWLTKNREWKFMEDWTFVLPDGTTGFIPKGFVFDGASIPKLFRNIISPTGILFISSIFHDFGYKNGYIWIIKKDVQIKHPFMKTRNDFDKLLKAIAIQITNYNILSKASYYILKWMGWLAWNNYRKKEKLNG